MNIFRKKADGTYATLTPAQSGVNINGDSAVETTTAVEMNSGSVLYSAAKIVISTPTGVAAATTSTFDTSRGNSMNQHTHHVNTGATMNFSVKISICGIHSILRIFDAATCAPRV